MYWVYVLYSKSIDKFYKGITSNTSSRLNYHNKGWNLSTKKGIPWVLIWKTDKPSKKEAAILEKKLKNLTRQKLIRIMLKYQDRIEGLEIQKWLIYLFNN